MSDTAPSREDEKREQRRIADLESLSLEQRESLESLSEAIHDESWRIRKKAIELLLQHSERAFVVQKLAQIAAQSKDPTPRNTALEGLVACQDTSVDHLCGQTTSPNPARRLFIDTLGLIGERRAAKAVIGALGDEDENVQMAAAEALGKIGGPEAREALERALRADHLMVTVAALDSLWKLGQKIEVPRLFPLVENRGTRRPAIRALGLTGTPEAIPKILEALQDRARSTRQAALEACVVLQSLLASSDQQHLRRSVGKLSSEAIRRLAEESESRQPSVRRAVATVLSWTRDKTILENLLSAALDEETGEHALDALCAMAPTVVPELGRLAQSFSNKRRQALYELISRLPGADKGDVESLVDRAIGDLSSPDDDLKSGAMKVLAEMGSERCLKALFDLLTDKGLDPFTRHEAARAVGAVGTRHQEAVIASLKSLPSPPDANDLRPIITQIQSPELFPYLDSLLTSPSSADRREGVKSLTSYTEDPRAEKLAIKALSDSDGPVRAAAASTMSSFSSKQSAEALIEALFDPDPEVRSRAAGSLGHRRWRPAYDPLKEVVRKERDPLVLVSALEALGTLDPIDDERIFHRALEHENPEVVKAGLSILTPQNPGLKPLVLRRLNHEAWDVRLQAVRALSPFIHDPQVHSALEAFLEKETDGLVKKVAQESLASVKTPGEATP